MKEDNFKALQKEVTKLIDDNICDNEKAVIDFINTMLQKFNSKLTVRKNMSINSFQTLLYNSETVEDFDKYLNKLDVNKEYEINSLQDIKDAEQFNEDNFKYNHNIEEYEQYKKFLNSRIQFNSNLFIIEYK